MRHSFLLIGLALVLMDVQVEAAPICRRSV